MSRVGPLRSSAFASLLCACALSVAQPHPGGFGEEAAIACVAARYRGVALAIARDEPEGRHERSERGVFELRWLTPSGNVLNIRVSNAACRFLEVEGVGQVEARILP